jgi:hypothetical protein
MHFLVECLETGHHAFAERSLYSYWGSQIANAFGQPERNQLRNRQLDACSKGITKINHYQISRGSLYEEILEVSVSDSEDIGDETDGGVVGDEPVFDMQKRVIIFSQFFQTKPQKSVRDEIFTTIHIFDYLFFGPRHQSLVPGCFIVVVRTQSLEIVVKLIECLIFSGKIGLWFSFQNFELCFIKGS